MEKAIKAFWHGIKAGCTTAVNWVTTLFGMTGNRKRSSVLLRVVGVSFALVVTVWGVYSLTGCSNNSGRDVTLDENDGVACYYNYLSDDIYYCKTSNGNGYVFNAKGKMMLNHVLNISRPMEGDSLVWFSNGKKRGYFHLRDGRLVVKPTYEHAWVFSDGLAAVEEKGRVKFINTEGQVVIDRSFAYDASDDGYVFHEGHCAVNDSAGKHMGLIDRSGEWVLPPVYNNIYPIDTFWLVTLDNRQAVLSFSMDTILPLSEAEFSIRDASIKAVFSDHTVNTYSLQGELIAANQIRDVEQLMYETREVVYPNNSNDDSYYDSEPYFRKATATCLCYNTEWNWCGLMSPDGRQITPPIYSRIEAVGKDLYLCKYDYVHGVLLNSRGQRVK